MSIEHHNPLIKEYLSGNAKKSRKAEKRLLHALQQHNADFDLRTVSDLQQHMTGKNPALIKKAATLIGIVLGSTVIDRRETGQPLTITPHTSALCESLERADQQLPKNHFLQSILPSAYTELMREVIPEVKQKSRDGLSQLILPLTQPEWAFKARKHLSQLTETTEAENPSLQDSLIDLIKTPVKPSPFGYPRLSDKPFAGISLAGIEQMSRPLSQSDYLKVTDFLIAVFSQQLHPAETAILLQLFKQQAYFSSAAEGRITYRNRVLLANLNSWQEELMTRLLFKQDEVSDSQMQKLLLVAPDNFTQWLPAIMATWTYSAAEADPDFSSQETLGDYSHIATCHPLSALATSSYLDEHPNIGLSVNYLEELSRRCMIERFLPLLERRLKQFGFLERCSFGMDVIQNKLTNPPFGRFLFWH